MPAIGRLGALLVREHHDFDPERFIAATPRTAQGYGSFLGTRLQEPNIMALRGPAGVLYDIVVDPAHRKQGIGRMLLDATLEALKAKGAPRVVLSTAEPNVTAQHLFEGAGFRRTMIEMTREA